VPIIIEARRKAGVAPATDITHGFQVLATNTGYASYLDPALGRLLTSGDLIAHAGVMSVSDLVGNGGTITKHAFRGGLIVDRDNITFNQCEFTTNLTAGYAGTEHAISVNWCTWLPSGVGDYAIGYNAFTAYRCNIGGSSDGLKAGGPATATECFIRVKGQDALDHNDGVQNSGGAGLVTIERCNIDCRPTNGIGGPNAALFTADAASGLQVWTDNYVAGGGYVMRLYENATYNVQGNWVLDGSWTFGPTHRAVIPSTDVIWGTVRPNVLVDSSGTVLSTLTAP
jgi:hypothetical protein